MKKIYSIAAVCTLAAGLSAAAVSADGGDVIYGTMQIPYQAFYENEGVAAEVDGVSSATEEKWKSESLVAGTYSEEHADDNGGDILGVVYPVAISEEDLAALGDDDYGFEELSEVPAAYKTVTVENGEAVFSEVNGEESAVEATAEITTDTPWGDYAISTEGVLTDEGSTIGTIAGVLLKTSDDSVYAMRHLENIWRSSIGFSTGFTTTEPHGNTLLSENYAEMMGKTISEIIYITDTGYHTLSCELYVPVKFDGGVEVESVSADQGNAAVTLTVPEDYDAVFTVNGLECEITAESITFEGALPGAYTLSVEDGSGVYAPLSASFVLSTDELPVVFDAESGAIVAADGADESLKEAFVANIVKVTVGETEYSASGHGAVSIIDLDGELDSEAAISGGRGADAQSTPIFGEAGDYEITVEADGFTQALQFTYTVE